MTEPLTPASARVELIQLETRVNELRAYLRGHTPSGLTRMQVLLAEQSIGGEPDEAVAADLGMHVGEYRKQLADVMRKFGVTTRGGLAAALYAVEAAR